MESTEFSVENHYLIPTFAKLPISIEKAKGLDVWDQTGRQYLDLYGGHAVSLLGHSHPRLVEALSHQASKLFFYSGVCYSSVRALAAKALVDFIDRDMQIFFSNSGAEANENALKIARIVSGRKGVISFEGAFHGRTSGAIAVTGIKKYRVDDSPDVRFAKFGDLDSLRTALDESIGAVIFESIQSLSGVRTPTKEYYREAFELCRKNGTKIIFDEIQTGLGRCGSKMLFHKYEIEPDIITLAKGLAGGFPVGATLATREITQKLKQGDLGSTFGGGPMACALILETLSVIKDENLVQNSENQHQHLEQLLKNMEGVLEVRGEGLLIGIKTRKAASEVVQECLHHGILIGTSLDPEVVRLLPPLTVHQESLEVFSRTLKEIL